MSDIGTLFSKLAVKIESTFGTYVAPTNDDFIKTAEEVPGMSESKSELRANFRSGNPIEKSLKLKRISEVSWNFSVYAQPDKILGSAPVYSRCFESYGFDKTELNARQVSGLTNTVNSLNFADTSAFKVGQVVLIKESEKSANPDHVSPISAINTNTSIELEISADNAFSDNVEIELQTEFVENKSEGESLSITHIFEGDEKEQRVTGAKCNSITLNNYASGDALPTLAFSGQGKEFKELLNSSNFDPNFAEGDLLLPEYIFVDGVKLCVAELSFEMSKDLSARECAGAKTLNALRAVGLRTSSGSFSLFKEQLTEDFKLNDTKRSLFFYVAEYEDAECKVIKNFISFYMPETQFLTKELGDNEGFWIDSMGFESFPSDVTKGTRIVIG